MNSSMYKLVALLLLGSSTGYSINAMNKVIAVTDKTISNKELIEGIKSLPVELRLYIISLLVKSSNLTYQISLWKKLVMNRHSYRGIVSPNGETILTYGLNKTKACLWDVQTGKLIRIFKGDFLKTFQGHLFDITSLAFSPEGKTILTGSDDRTACLWDVQTGKLITTFKGHTGKINSLAFSSQGKTILTGSDDRTACLWDVQTEKLIITFKGHTGKINSVAFSSEGKKVLTGSSEDCTARLWNSKTGELLTTFKKDYIYLIVFSPDGETIFTGTYGHYTASLWSSNTGELITTFTEHTDFISSVAFSPDGKAVLTGSSRDGACLWSVKTGKLLTTLKDYTTNISSLVFSPNGRTILLAGEPNKMISLWKLWRSFEGLSEEQKKIWFEQFKTYYSLLLEGDK